MNWVERKYLKEKAISDGAPNLWLGFCTEIKDSVDAFNKCFAPAGGPVACEPQSNHLHLSRKLRPEIVAPQSNVRATVEATFEAAKDPPRIVTQTSRPNVKGGRSIVRTHDFAMSADQEGRAFLVHHAEEVSFEQAAQIVLEDYLFKD